MALVDVTVVAPETVRDGDWTYTGGAADFSNIQSADEATTTADSGNSLGLLIGSSPNGAMPDAYVINLYRACCRHRGTGGTQAEFKIGIYSAIGAGSAYGAQQTSAAAFADYYETFATDGDAVAWDQYRMENNRLILRKDTTVADSNWQVTFAWYEITYGPNPAGWSYLVSQWIPPLLAVASHGLLHREVVSILKNLRSRPTESSEVRRLLEVFIRRPAYGFLA
jgi:hypothetical protein